MAEAAGAHVDAIYHCPHERGVCALPQAGARAARRRGRAFGAAPAETVMIGDADSDVEAGRRFGARTIQLTAGPSASARWHPICAAAVRLVLAA